MRIRKRLPPPPPAVSDPQLRRSPPDRPSGESGSTHRRNGKWVFPSYDDETDDDHRSKLKELEDDERWVMEMKSTHDGIRKIVNYISSGEASDDDNRIHVLHKSTSSAQENKMVPLKKRKGSFERTPLNDEIISISSTSKMQSKTNKKCDDQIPVIVEANGITNDFSTKNKSKRGKVIMEGSRCSRINGRGWRCHQPTLVGYSLCEHHLGKGRLRSVAANRPVPEMSGLPPLPEAEQPALTVRKKRNKVGVVKARSMSSLLSQI